MLQKKRLLEKSRLYAILDKKAAGSKSLLDIAASLKNGGIDIIQLRNKESKKEEILENAFLIRKMLLPGKTIFIVNDYPDIAKISDADGLHLGRHDTSITRARQILGPHKIIGVSCQTLAQALKAQREGADYLGIGPIYPTPAKPEIKKGLGLGLLKELRKRIKIPFFVIGNINSANIDDVLSAGAERVAICRAILQTNNISSAARFFYNKLHGKFK